MYSDAQSLRRIKNLDSLFYSFSLTAIMLWSLFNVTFLSFAFLVCASALGTALSIAVGSDLRAKYGWSRTLRAGAALSAGGWALILLGLYIEPLWYLSILGLFVQCFFAVLSVETIKNASVVLSEKPHIGLFKSLFAGRNSLLLGAGTAVGVVYLGSKDIVLLATALGGTVTVMLLFWAGAHVRHVKTQKPVKILNTIYRGRFDISTLIRVSMIHGGLSIAIVAYNAKIHGYLAGGVTLILYHASRKLLGERMEAWVQLPTQLWMYVGALLSGGLILIPWVAPLGVVGPVFAVAIATARSEQKILRRYPHDPETTGSATWLSILLTGVAGLPFTAILVGYGAVPGILLFTVAFLLLSLYSHLAENVFAQTETTSAANMGYWRGW